MLLFLITTFFQVSISQLQRQATVDGLIPTSNGVTLTHNPLSSNTFGSSYNISVHSQDAYDILLSLEPQWGFKSSANTTLIITIDGATPDPTSDADLLTVFSVGNTQFFSFFVHLDTLVNHRSKIYPLNTIGTEPSVSTWIADETTYSQRWDRISNGGTDQDWKNTSPRWNQKNTWPLKFEIINDPINDLCEFKFYDEETIYRTGNIFNKSFNALESIDLYIMGDTANEWFQIHAIDVEQYHIDGVPSIAPSTTIGDIGSTTNIPSITPTLIPSITPTYIPTIAPISTNNPSVFPTLTPTDIPTTTPTDNPTITPTDNPTTTPTDNPTLTPTDNPTLTPSDNPTTSPFIDTITSVSPTEHPVLITTSHALLIPTTTPSDNPTEHPVVDITTDPTSIETTSNPTQSNTEIPSVVTTSRSVLNTTDITSMEPVIRTTDDSDAIVIDTVNTSDAQPQLQFETSSYIIIVIIFCSVCFIIVLLLLVSTKRNNHKKRHKVNKDTSAIAMDRRKDHKNGAQIRAYHPVKASSANVNIHVLNDDEKSYSRHTTESDEIIMDEVAEEIRDLKLKREHGTFGMESEGSESEGSEPDHDGLNPNRFLEAVRDGIKYEDTETKDIELDLEDTKYNPDDVEETEDDGYRDRTQPMPFIQQNHNQFERKYQPNPAFFDGDNINNDNDTDNDTNKNEAGFIINPPPNNTTITHSTTMASNDVNINDNVIVTGINDINDMNDMSDIHGISSSGDDSYHNRMETYDFVENLQVLNAHDMAIKNRNKDINMEPMMMMLEVMKSQGSKTPSLNKDRLSLKVEHGDIDMDSITDDHYQGEYM